MSKASTKPFHKLELELVWALAWVLELRPER